MRYHDLAAWVLGEPPRLGSVRLVTVDGPAGSGKSTFAERLAAALGEAAFVVHMDDLYAGWGDLRGVWPRVEEWVLGPLRAGRVGRMRRYDWHAGRFGERLHEVPSRQVLILEGVGSGRRAAEPDTTVAVFVEAPRDERLRRGIERDGEALRGEWLRWMAGEEELFAAEAIRERADIVVDGTAEHAGEAMLNVVRMRAAVAIRPDPGGSGPTRRS